MNTIKVALDDITNFDGDAIVNAANAALSGGGGVDGAIHRAAGPELLAECRKLGRCPPGEVRITKAYNLKCKYVIHAVGPVWYGGHKNERDLLKSCYIKAMNIAIEHGIQSIAFPNISCGVYKFPPDEAADISITALSNWLEDNPNSIDEIVICCFEQKLFKINNQRIK